MRYPLRHLLLTLACSAALAANAQTPRSVFDVPAGDLSAALNTLARQSDAQLVYPADQIKGLQTTGSQGAASLDQALNHLLSGSGFSAKRDASGAILIQRSAVAAPAPIAPSSSETPIIEDEKIAPISLDTVQVTGSRIPRSQVEGPAPMG